MSETPTVAKTESGSVSYSWLRVVEGDRICDDKGEPIYEEFDFADKDYNITHFVIATPNISAHKLDDLKRILGRDADGYELDLGVSINCSLEGDKPKELKRWELGWDDYRRVSIDVYPKEFFESQPNAKDVFEQKIVPQIATWNEMNSPGYGFSKNKK